MAKGIDWIKIRTEYETGNISQRKLCVKHGVSFNTLKDKANREQWAKTKKETHNKIAIKTQQKAVDRIVSRNDKILSIADKLANKIEQAVEQLESYLVTNKIKTKTVEYNGKETGFKPQKEVVVEQEIKEIVSGIIDKQGLKFLTTALRDIKELQPKEDNNDSINKNNDNIVVLAGLLNDPVETRTVDEFAEDE